MRIDDNNDAFAFAFTSRSSSTMNPITSSHNSHNHRFGITRISTGMRVNAADNNNDDDDGIDEFGQYDLFTGSAASSSVSGAVDSGDGGDYYNEEEVESSDDEEGQFNEEGNPIVEYNEFVVDEEDTLDYMLEIGEASGDFDEHVPKFNLLSMIGRLGSDPEARYFESGSVVVNVGLAVTRTYDPIEREVKGVKYGQEETDWFALEVWGKDAEYISNYASKGARVGVTGQIVVDAWTNKSQELRTKATILVETIEILETKAESQLRRSQSSKRSGRSNSGRQQQQWNNDGLQDRGYSTGFRVDDDNSSPSYPPSAGSDSFF